MSDQTLAAQVAAPVVDTKAQAAKVEATPAQEPFDAERAKALIDKLRDEVKALKPFEKKAADFEKLQKEQADKDLSELQKAQKTIAELEAKTKAAERREMQRQVAKEYKLPDEIAELLPGDDLETMKAKAVLVSKAIPASTPSLSPTNPGSKAATVTDDQRRAFMFGNGPLPGA